VANNDELYYFDRDNLDREALIEPNLTIDNQNAIVRNPRNALQQYTARIAIGINAFRYTDDGWATWITRNPLSFSLARIFAPLRRQGGFDFIFFGKSDITTSAPDAVEIMYTPTGTPVGKAGTSPGTTPYTDSIPRTCGGVIDGGVIVAQ